MKIDYSSETSEVVSFQNKNRYCNNIKLTYHNLMKPILKLYFICILKVATFHVSSKRRNSNSKRRNSNITNNNKCNSNITNSGNRTVRSTATASVKMIASMTATA